MAYRDPVTGLIGGTPPGYSPSPVGGRRSGYTTPDGLNVTVMLPPGVSLEEHLQQNPPPSLETFQRGLLDLASARGSRPSSGWPLPLGTPLTPGMPPAGPPGGPRISDPRRMPPGMPPGLPPALQGLPPGGPVPLSESFPSSYTPTPSPLGTGFPVTQTPGGQMPPGMPPELPRLLPAPPGPLPGLGMTPGMLGTALRGGAPGMKWLELQGLSLGAAPLKKDPPAIGLGVSGLGGNRTLGYPFGSLFGAQRPKAPPGLPPVGVPISPPQTQAPVPLSESFPSPYAPTPSPLGTGLQPAIGTGTPMQQSYEPFQRLDYMPSPGTPLGPPGMPRPSPRSTMGTTSLPPSPLGTGLQPAIGTPGGQMPSPQQQATPPFPNQFTGLGQGNIPSGGLGTFGNAFSNTLQWPFGPR